MCVVGMALTNVANNIATAAMLTPIAYSVGIACGANPAALAVCVLLATNMGMQPRPPVLLRPLSTAKRSGFPEVTREIRPCLLRHHPGSYSGRDLPHGKRHVLMQQGLEHT